MPHIFTEFTDGGQHLPGWPFALPALVDATTSASRNHGGPIEALALALLAFQLYVAWRERPRLRANWLRPGIRVLTYAVVSLSLITLFSLVLVSSGAMYSANFLPVGPSTTIVAVGYFWIVLSSFALAAVLVTRYLLDRRIPAMHSSARRTWLLAAGGIALAAPSAVAAFGVLVERHQYRILELDLPVASLHPDFEGFRVVQVSDLHVSPFLSVREAARVIDMANELRADLALFTGDLITERGDPLDDAIRELIRLRAPWGVLGCMGNHEEYIGCRNYLQRETAKAGLTFLRNTATLIRRGQGVLNIAGVDYQRSENRRNYIPGAERLVVAGMPNILLSHNPDVFPAAIGRGFQSVISGHTHGGQVNVEILHQNINPSRFRTPFTSGLYRQDDATCFVTNGIGTIGMPIRLGAPPEVALLRLRRA
jgi:hypothetical protein